MAGVDFTDAYAVIYNLLAETSFGDEGVPGTIIQDIYSLPSLDTEGLTYPIIVMQSEEAIKFLNSGVPAQMLDISLPLNIYFIMESKSDADISSIMANHAETLFNAIRSNRLLSGTVSRIEIRSLDWSPENVINSVCVENDWAYHSAMIELVLYRSIGR